MRKFNSILAIFVAVAVGFGSLGFVNDACALRTKTKSELDAAKKAGDLSVEEADKFRQDFGREADEANVEVYDEKTKGKVKKKASGASSYGVAGFDYLTGVGKVASTPDDIGADLPKALGGGKLVSKNKSPLDNLIKSRYKHKWTGQLGETYSGWGEESGVTEAWFRSHDSGSKLGGDYNEWVNQWNNITRPRHDGKTMIPGTDPDQGAHWFSFYCIHCHGWTGKGNGPTAAKLDPRPRNLTNGKYANFISNLDLFQVIKGGGEARNMSSSMPPWGNIMQDQDIWNTVSFIRSLAVPKYMLDPEDVTAANAKDNEDFQDMNEMMEVEGFMAGRGGGNIGGYSSIGGGRLASELVGVKGGLKTSDSDASAKTGDWAMDTK